MFARYLYHSLCAVFSAKISFQFIAMPSVDRTFYVPTSVDPSASKIPIVLREPSLTADNLGHKTWGASYMLAKRLPLLSQHLPILHSRDLSKQTRHSTQNEEQVQHRVSLPSPRVLELGAGTGLVGIAASATFSTIVDLTDLPVICENLEHNVLCNRELIGAYEGCMTCFPLDWSDLPSPGTILDKQYDIILAADPLYSPNHPTMLANTMAVYLVKEKKSRVVVELPLREAYQPEIDCFRQNMKVNGLALVREGEDIGYDDWGNGTIEVRCWWGIWAWATFLDRDAVQTQILLP